MAWVYRDAKRLAGVVTVRLDNAQDAESFTFPVFYYGQGDPATDPAFTTHVQTRIAEQIAGKEQERVARLDETNRFRPRAEPGGK
jgi:hypothetical protein